MKKRLRCRFPKPSRVPRTPRVGREPLSCVRLSVRASGTCLAWTGLARAKLLLVPGQLGAGLSETGAARKNMALPVRRRSRGGAGAAVPV